MSVTPSCLLPLCFSVLLDSMHTASSSVWLKHTAAWRGSLSARGLPLKVGPRILCTVVTHIDPKNSGKWGLFFYIHLKYGVGLKRCFRVSLTIRIGMSVELHIIAWGGDLLCHIPEWHLIFCSSLIMNIFINCLKHSITYTWGVGNTVLLHCIALLYIEVFIYKKKSEFENFWTFETPEWYPFDHVGDCDDACAL